MNERTRPVRVAILLWGVGGVLLLLANALGRLIPVALEPLREGLLTPAQLFLYCACAAANAYAEGYRGFQKRFCPRVIARAVHLAQHPRPLHVLFAPLFCMTYFHASRRGRYAAWGVSLMVMLAITVVRHVPQPWRGIIDAGVVVGLGWGAACLLISLVRVLGGELPAGDPSLPEPRPT